MKRSFYTLLVATAISLPLAAFAQTGPLSGTSSTAPTTSGPGAAPAPATTANTSIDTTAGSVARSTNAAAGETGVGIQSGANLATGAGAVPNEPSTPAPADVTAPAAPAATATSAPAAPSPTAPAEATVNTNTTMPAAETTATPAQAQPQTESAPHSAESHANNEAMPVKRTAKMEKPDVSKDTIVKIQESLIAQGQMKGRADGAWGPMTAKALRKYQAANGLKASGKIDADTLNKMGLQMGVTGEATVQPAAAQGQ